jgi:hypothetical protein
MAENMVKEEGKNLKTTGTMVPTLYGWPASGGVWVFKPSKEQWMEYNRLSGTTTDMEEHCSNLQRFGATFYADINQCAEARDAAAMHT